MNDIFYLALIATGLYLALSFSDFVTPRSSR
jgi:hypothetical protein